MDYSTLIDEILSAYEDKTIKLTTWDLEFLEATRDKLDLLDDPDISNREAVKLRQIARRVGISTND